MLVGGRGDRAGVRCGTSLSVSLQPSLPLGWLQPRRGDVQSVPCVQAAAFPLSPCAPRPAVAVGDPGGDSGVLCPQLPPRSRRPRRST